MIPIPCQFTFPCSCCPHTTCLPLLLLGPLEFRVRLALGAPSVHLRDKWWPLCKVILRNKFKQGTGTTIEDNSQLGDNSSSSWCYVTVELVPKAIFRVSTLIFQLIECWELLMAQIKTSFSVYQIDLMVGLLLLVFHFLCYTRAQGMRMDQGTRTRVHSVGGLCWGCKFIPPWNIQKCVSVINLTCCLSPPPTPWRWQRDEWQRSTFRAEAATVPILDSVPFCC